MPNLLSPPASSSPLLLPVWLLTICAVVGALRVAGELLAPVALALYLATVLTPAVDWLRRRGIPRVVAALLPLAALVALGAGLFEATSQPARHWLETAPQTLRAVEHKVDPLRAAIARFDQATSHVEKLAEGAPVAPAAPSHPPASTRLLMALPHAVTTAFAVVAFTAFLLVGGPPLLSAFAASRFSGPGRGLMTAAASACAAIGRYVATIAAINVGLGAATAGLTLALGLPNPLLWGCVAAGLNFIPYFGSALTITLLTVVALVTFNTLGPVLAVFFGYLALTTIEGQVVQPLLIGRRMALSPLVVFAAVWFGGWLWGVAGIVLAVPALVAIKAATPAVGDPEPDTVLPLRRARWRLRPTHS